MFVKGQKVAGGEHLSTETKAKVIADRKAGKKWKDIAADLGIPTKRAMSWAKRKWFKQGMIDEKGKDIIDKIKNKPPVTDKDKTDEPPVTDKDKDKDKDKTNVVDRTKDKAKDVVSEIDKHIKKSDSAPKQIVKQRDKGKDTDQVDKVTKKGLSVPKSVGMWFLLAIVIAVVVIFVVFLLLKPSKEEKGDYNQPTGEKKSQPGFENRNIDDL